MVGGDQFNILCHLMAGYVIEFRLIEHEWFTLLDGGMSCIKKVASSGEANVLYGRQKSAVDPSHAESGLILLRHTVVDNMVFSKYRLELRLKEPFGGLSHSCIGVCILDESDHMVLTGGSNPYSNTLKLNRLWSCTIFTDKRMLNIDTYPYQALKSHDRFQVIVDSKCNILTVRNLANNTSAEHSYFEEDGSPNIKRLRLSFISFNKGTHFAVTSQSWLQ